VGDVRPVVLGEEDGVALPLERLDHAVAPHALAADVALEHGHVAVVRREDDDLM
jgi:hypothetical protein